MGLQLDLPGPHLKRFDGRNEVVTDAMPNASRSTDVARPRRGRPVKGAELTPDRLVDAAIAIIAADGPASLSTSRIAQAVNITQSGFYAHFANMDACLAAIAARVERDVRIPVARGMERLRETDPTDPDNLDAYMTSLLDLVEERAVLRDLFLPYRGDRSKVGALLDACEAELVDDLTGHLKAILPAAKPGLDRTAACRALAHMLMAQTFAAIEAWRRGELPRSVVTRLLAEQTARIGESAARAGLLHSTA